MVGAQQTNNAPCLQGQKQLTCSKSFAMKEAETNVTKPGPNKSIIIHLNNNLLAINKQVLSTKCWVQLYFKQYKHVN